MHHCFCEVRVARCLAEAERSLRAHETELDALEGELDGSDPTWPAAGKGAGGRAGRLRRAHLPLDLFARFDGRWRGHWSSMPVEHIWRTLDPATQLVIIDDGGTRKRGINLVGADGMICGIVLEPGGPRRHHGHYRHRLDTLEWTTPDAVYRERVEGPPGRRRYRIEEHRLRAPPGLANERVTLAPTSRRRLRRGGSLRGLVPGTKATYREVAPDEACPRRASPRPRPFPS